MPGPFGPDASAEAVWQWLLVPTPPNMDAASKLLMQAEQGLAIGSIADWDSPAAIFLWDYAHRSTPGVMPSFESGN